MKTMQAEREERAEKIGKWVLTNVFDADIIFRSAEKSVLRETFIAFCLVDLPYDLRSRKNSGDRGRQKNMWGLSSDGRALRSHRRGQGFDSPRLHQMKRRYEK